MTPHSQVSEKTSRLPHELVWAIATLSLVLPFAAIGIGAVGFWRLLSGDTGGWPLLATALGLLALDLIIDLWIANPHTSESEDPRLNRRGVQAIGRMASLAEAIEGGRGKIRLADTVWIVEGPDLPVGARVRVIGCDGTVLQVEPE
jgi:inner membrane protein